jgi:hypothetical protein
VLRVVAASLEAVAFSSTNAQLSRAPLDQRLAVVRRMPLA